MVHTGHVTLELNLLFYVLSSILPCSDLNHLLIVMKHSAGNIRHVCMCLVSFRTYYDQKKVVIYTLNIRQ